VAKVKNCKVHYVASHTTMSGYDCRNKCVFSFRRNDNSDVAVVTSRGRVFQILRPAVANERSPTVMRWDGRTSRRLVDDGRRRVLNSVLFDNTTTIYLISLLWKLGLDLRVALFSHFFTETRTFRRFYIR